MFLQIEEIILGSSPLNLSTEQEEKILDILVYLWNNYDKDNREDHFSASRATKMVFLVDWYYARYNKNNWRQATAIPWYYNLYGPYVNLIAIVKRRFKIVSDDSITLFELKEEDVDTSDSLDRNIKEMSDMVINNTQNLRYFGFINYIHDTTAVKLSERGEQIQISQIARKIYAET